MQRLLIYLFLATAAALAQHASPNPGKIVPRLWPGYGSLRFEVSTKSPEAQKWANQGLRLVYAFNHPEAAASFRKATELDPDCAMCWWGLSFALGNNINAPLMPENATPAYDAAQKALALAPKASPREAAYIQALVTRYAPTNPADRSALDKAFADAMHKVAQQFPDDLNAQTLYADSLMNLTPWKLWTRDGKPNTYSEEIVRVLETVIHSDAVHLGANHMYIHAVEASLTPERALPSAAILNSLAPASGHLVHMPAHIYMRTGDYEKALELNIKAAALDKSYFASVGGPTFYTPYWFHNLSFAGAAGSMLGSYKTAREAIGEAARQLEPVARMEPMFEAPLCLPLMLEVRFQQWDKILAIAEPASFSLSVNNVWHFARGMAFAAKGDLAAARTSLSAFTKSIGALSAERGFGLNTEKAVMTIAIHVLEAKIAWAAKDSTATIAALREAVQGEDSLNYDEPADWYYPPTREALGAVLLLSGQAAAAELVFREELVNNRRNGRALFGLHAALQAQQKMDSAAMVEPLYKAAWRKADKPLTLDQLF